MFRLLFNRPTSGYGGEMIHETTRNNTKQQHEFRVPLFVWFRGSVFSEHEETLPHCLHPISFALIWRSDAGRESLRRFAGVPTRGALQRLDGACFIKMEYGIELLGEARVKIVAGALQLRSIDDADSAFEPGGA